MPLCCVGLILMCSAIIYKINEIQQKKIIKNIYYIYLKRKDEVYKITTIFSWLFF